MKDREDEIEDVGVASDPGSMLEQGEIEKLAIIEGPRLDRSAGEGQRNGLGVLSSPQGALSGLKP